MALKYKQLWMVEEMFRTAKPVYRLFGAAEKLATDNLDAGHSFPPASRQKAYARFDRWLKLTDTSLSKQD